MTTLIEAKLAAKEAKLHFGKILFIVKYNYHAPLEKLLLHSSLWSKIFEHQLLVAPYNTSMLQFAKEKVGDNIEMLSCKSDDEFGYLAYSSLSTAINMYPHYEGYLYAHDDMALNISKLRDLDLHSFWQSDYDPSTSFTSTSMPTILDDTWTFRNHSWPWFNRYQGIDAMQNALRKYPIIREGLEQCTGSQKRWFIGPSDFLYVPQQQSSLYINIMEKLAAEKVFLEIAIPTFIACFVSKKIVEKIIVCTFYDENRGNIAHMSHFCPPLSSAFHPVKISGHHNFKFMIEKSDVSFEP